MREREERRGGRGGVRVRTEEGRTEVWVDGILDGRSKGVRRRGGGHGFYFFSPVPS